MQEKQRLAIHEASHAVCAHVLGKAYGCRIWDGVGLAGTGDLTSPPQAADYTHEKIEGFYAERTLEALATDAVITAAGCVGESLARYDPQAVPSFCDRQLLQAGFRSAFPECGDFDAERAWSALAIGRARAILHARWGAVEAVSQALEREGSLTADQVAALIERPVP